MIQFRGLRLLKQDPAEALLSFVCSAANSIPRISAAIEALAQRYGEMVCEFDGGCYYRFPAVESIAGCEESLLDRSEVLGFRDRTLRDVACQVIRKGDGWLDGLRSANYSEARDELVTLRGVGRKIADCVCLFALGKDEAVPVDTHIRQIAERLWMPHLKTKSITAAAYDRIANELRGAMANSPAGRSSFFSMKTCCVRGQWGEGWVACRDASRYRAALPLM